MKIALVLATLVNPVSFDIASEGYRNIPSALRHSLTQSIQQARKARQNNTRKAANVIDVKVRVLSSRRNSTDLYVTCKGSSVVLTYSKTANTFCAPDASCYRSLKAAIIPYCQ